MITHCEPPRTAFSAAAQSASTPFASAPSLPSPAYVAATRSAPRPFIARSASTSSSNSTGDLIDTAGMSFAPSLFRRLPLAPMVISSDMTSPSRSGSIAGLVTCANLCLK